MHNSGPTPEWRISGGFGHLQSREFMLDCATRAVLANIAALVLLSH